MAADKVKILSAGPVALGEVLVCGRLMSPDGQRLAGFQQTTRIWRGSPVIELLIEVEPERMPGADPWNSYYAARFAWLDPEAKLFRGANLATVPTEAVQLVSPHFLDIRTEKTRTTLLAAGLPYHRRYGQRKLDTLLLVRGETARRFRLGIALDPPNPLSAALDFLAPPAMLPDAARPGRDSGWLFHLDVRGVLATHWEPLTDGPAGFRVRLLETDGRAVSLNLRSFRTRLRREAQQQRRARRAAADRGRPPEHRPPPQRVGGSGGEVQGQGLGIRKAPRLRRGGRAGADVVCSPHARRPRPARMAARTTVLPGDHFPPAAAGGRGEADEAAPARVQSSIQIKMPSVGSVIVL